MGLERDGIQNLSEVNAVLMKNLTRLTTCVVATTFIFTPSDQTTADYLFETVDSSSSQNNAIGDVFRSTSEFIRILHDFRDALLDFTPQAARNQEDRNDNESGMDEVLNRWNLLILYKDRPQGYLDSLHPRPSISDSPSAIPSTPRLSMTSRLTVLTCYPGSPSRPLHGQLAPVIAGLQINTFALDSSRDRAMQFKILLQTCEHMLDKMENALRFDFVNEVENHTVFTDPAFREMLQILLQQEGLQTDSPDEDITGTMKLRSLLMKLRKELD